MKTAPFRIAPKHTRKTASPNVAAAPSVQAGEAETSDIGEYAEKLTKMIPGEVVALYVAGSGVVPAEEHLILLSWSIFCFAAVIVVRALGTRDPNSGAPQWGAVAIAAVSFVIWLYSLGGPFEWYLGSNYEPFVGALLILGWTFIAPLLYSPKEPAPS